MSPFASIELLFPLGLVVGLLLQALGFAYRSLADVADCGAMSD
jgi:hypothetical protein